MSIVQELESLLGITLDAPFDMILTSFVLFFFLALTYNFIKLLFRVFTKRN